MTDRITFRILGCGSSGGVPRLGGHWGDCDPNNPRNRRQRCSLLITRTSASGVTRVLIDTSPDLRNQLLDAQIDALDAVVYTHAHADHVHGIDDLRMLVINMRKQIPVWADDETSDALLSRFGYIFKTPAGSSYPPICELNTMDGPFDISGAGGVIRFDPIHVTHGNIPALGFRIGDVAYIPDVSDIPAPAWDQLQGLDLWIIDALRRSPHPSHSHLENTLEWIVRSGAASAILTNMHTDLDYATVAAETPGNVTPAYDGFDVSFDLPS